ncbi:MAG: cupredoxin domain-containing protein [Sneathiella sp.]
MRILFSLLVASAVLISAGTANAEELVVSQKKKRFDPALLNAKLGDTVLFDNDDRYAHNLFSETLGFEFNIRKQMPGDKHEMTLDKLGNFVVGCVIHPRMKMTIIVE